MVRINGYVDSNIYDIDSTLMLLKTDKNRKLIRDLENRAKGERLMLSDLVSIGAQIIYDSMVMSYQQQQKRFNHQEMILDIAKLLILHFDDYLDRKETEKRFG